MNIEKILSETQQIYSLAYSLEGAIIKADSDSKEMQRVKDLFYILFEKIESLQEEVNSLRGHISVCNAIYAVNHIEDLKAEIAKLREKSTH